MWIVTGDVLSTAPANLPLGFRVGGRDRGSGGSGIDIHLGKNMSSTQNKTRGGGALPHRGELFVTDAGLETELVFHDGRELPHFCAAVLLETDEGCQRLRDYYKSFIALARRFDVGIVLETPTWRLNPDWAERLGYGRNDCKKLNHDAVTLLAELRESANREPRRFVVSGLLGPRYDGYLADQLMTPEIACEYHTEQIQMLRDAGVDSIGAMTITNSAEANGIAAAARQAGLPAVIAFTLETDGRLPSGEALPDAINKVDTANPDAVTYFGINCAHPTHFMDVLTADEAWLERIGSIRANASRMSHEELDNAAELDAGDPEDLASRYRDLQARLPGLRVFGGCCGTDLRHVERIGEHCFSLSGP